MTHTIRMGNDGILRVSLIGDVSKSDFEAYQRDLTAFLDASTPENPLNTILDASQTAKLSSASRQGITQINKDPRIGQMAVLGASRPTRVFINFLLKATQRDNVDFFESDDNAVDWIKESKKKRITQENF